MTESSKIDFRYRRISQISDITDLVEMLFPGNRNQQHAAARILLALKVSTQPVCSLSHLEEQHNISRRTLQRTRAKLGRFGLIEHITWMNSRHGGLEGWKLSSRMSTALRQLANKIDRWKKDGRPERKQKDEMLAGLLK
jgi:hypothetical protein